MDGEPGAATVPTDSMSSNVGGSGVWSDDASGSARSPMAEHSMVVLSRSVELKDGRSLPSGTRGAIVFVHGGGAAYMVEFSKPFQAVATVLAADLSQVA